MSELTHIVHPNFFCDILVLVSARMLNFNYPQYLVLAKMCIKCEQLNLCRASSESAIDRLVTNNDRCLVYTVLYVYIVCVCV